MQDTGIMTKHSLTSRIDIVFYKISDTTISLQDMNLFGMTEIPSSEDGCSRANGWQFKLSSDQAQTADVMITPGTSSGEYSTNVSDLPSALQTAITSGQLWISESVALQGSLLGGLGYAAVGTLNGKNEQDYRYGVAPQALVALRLIMGNKASIDFTGREYFVSDVDEPNRGGHDNILRSDVAFTYRIHKKHAVSLKYQWNQRDATYPDLGNRKQTTGTIGIFYTFLGHDGFGATDWR